MAVRASSIRLRMVLTRGKVGPVVAVQACVDQVGQQEIGVGRAVIVMTESAITDSHRAVYKLLFFNHPCMTSETQSLLDRTDQLTSGGIVATLTFVFTVRRVRKKSSRRGG